MSTSCFIIIDDCSIKWTEFIMQPSQEGSMHFLNAHCTLFLQNSHQVNNYVRDSGVTSLAEGTGSHFSID